MTFRGPFQPQLFCDSVVKNFTTQVNELQNTIFLISLQVNCKDSSEGNQIGVIHFVSSERSEYLGSVAYFEDACQLHNRRCLVGYMHSIFTPMEQ